MRQMCQMRPNPLNTRASRPPIREQGHIICPSNLYNHQTHIVGTVFGIIAVITITVSHHDSLDQGSHFV